MFAVPAAAHFEAEFRTADGVYCGLLVRFNADGNSLDLAYVPRLLCWRPRDGFTVQMASWSRQPIAASLRSNRSYAPRTVLDRPLGKGERWWADRNANTGVGDHERSDVLFECVNGRAGVTCSNRAEHGFWVSGKQGYVVDLRSSDVGAEPWVAGAAGVRPGRRATFIATNFPPGWTVAGVLVPLANRGGNCCAARVKAAVRVRGDGTARLTFRWPRSYSACGGAFDCSLRSWRPGSRAIVSVCTERPPGVPICAERVVRVLRWRHL